MASNVMKFTGNWNGHCQYCTDPDEIANMIACDDCQHWLHRKCVGVIVDPPIETIFSVQDVKQSMTSFQQKEV